MNWEQARQRLRQKSGANVRRLGPTGQLTVNPDPLTAVRSSSICIASGKGGTGKSLVSASLGSLFATRGRALLVDADLGVGNAHILQDAAPDRSFVDVVEGRSHVREIVCRCSERLDLLAGGSGFARMAGLSAYEMHLLACGIEELEIDYKAMVVDSAAGISNQTVSFAVASDLVVLVTTPDITAMTDVYAFYKVLLSRKPSSAPLLVINRAMSSEEGAAAARRLSEVSRKFLGREPRFVAVLPEDRAAFRCTQRRVSVVEGEPEAPLSGALRGLFETIENELGRRTPQGLGRTLLRSVNYTPTRS